MKTLKEGKDEIVGEFVEGAKQETPPVEEKVFVQFGAEENGTRLYRVTRPFMLSTRYGPLEEVPRGALVRLDSKLGAEAFLGSKVEPVELGELFTVRRALHLPGPDGIWRSAEPGDIVKLQRAEAIDLLRRGYVKEGGTK